MKTAKSLIFPRQMKLNNNFRKIDLSNSNETNTALSEKRWLISSFIKIYKGERIRQQSIKFFVLGAIHDFWSFSDFSYRFLILKRRKSGCRKRSLIPEKRTKGFFCLIDGAIVVIQRKFCLLLTQRLEVPLICKCQKKEKKIPRRNYWWGCTLHNPISDLP